jgi:hypothetical protein
VKIVLVAGGLLVVAGFALGASLVPTAQRTPMSVPVGAPGAPVTGPQVPVLAPAVKAPAAANSIARTAEAQPDPAPPVVAAPPVAKPPTRSDINLQIQPIFCTRDHKRMPVCPPLPTPPPDRD